MPADLVLNVRQVAGYPPVSIAPPASQLLLQIAGLGSAYASISPADLVATALASGGDMFIGGKLSVQSIAGGSAQFSNASVNLLWAQKANVADFNASCGTINCVPIATIKDLNSLLAGVVSSFNLRTGAIMLSLADIIGAGGAPIASPAFSGAPSAPTAAIGTSTGQLATTAFVQEAVAGSVAGVVSFNTRSGAVVLTSADLIGVGGALLASPTFTGAPLAPTAAPGTNSTQLATCAFVAAAIAAAGASGVVTFNGRAGAVTLIANDISAAGGAIVASPAFSGTPTAPTPPPGDNSLRLATTAFVATAIAGVGAGFAPLASPAFTGTPTAPTPGMGDNSTRLATTAYVLAAITAIGAGVVTFNGRSGAVTLTTNDVTGAGGAPLASPAFTGVPTAPTAATATSTTQLATTAFVMAAIPAASSSAPLMDGTAAPGSSLAWSRGDHVHPTDTSRAAASALANYLSLSGGNLSGDLTGTTATFTGSLTTNGALNSQSAYGQTYVTMSSPGVALWANQGIGSNLLLDNGGNFVFNGPGEAVKAGGGPWVAPSDARLKTVDGDYPAGLDQILELSPVVFRYKGNDARAKGEPSQLAMVAGKRFVGLVAQAVEAVMPEMVTKRAGFLDGLAVDDIRDLDTSPLVYALVNAIKTLAARVAVLEATGWYSTIPQGEARQ